MGAFGEDSSATVVDGDQGNNCAVDSGAAYLFDLPGSAWTDEGCALAGLAGDPLLVGTGDLRAGSSNQVDLTNAAPSASAGLLHALGPATPAPFKGGTLKPVPLLGPPLIIPTSPTGEISIPFVMPGGVPPEAELWVQWAIQDGAAVAGVALSNAIKGVTP